MYSQTLYIYIARGRLYLQAETERAPGLFEINSGQGRYETEAVSGDEWKSRMGSLLLLCEEYLMHHSCCF